MKNQNNFCNWVWCCLYQEGNMAVASDGLVEWREAIFGTEVDVGASLHQDPDGLAAARLALNRQRQRRLCKHARTQCTRINANM